MKPFVALLALTIMSQFPAAHAQSKIELQPADTIRSVVERQTGQVVELRLKSGEKIGGKVEKMTDTVVHLSQLTGAEFFDAAVALSDISAVVVRTKGR